MKIFQRGLPTGRQGFTLVELLVVISIIGILVSVVAVNSNVARRQSRDTRRKADLQNVAGAIELYRATKRIYPTGTYLQLKADLLRYTTDIPTDPSTKQDYVYFSNGQKFALDAQLENAQEVDSITSTVSSSSSCIANPGDTNCYRTGTYHDAGGAAHYRVSGP